MNLLLKEFILSGDSEEAQRCLRDLEVPHFHHEFVYEVSGLSLVCLKNTVEESRRLIGLAEVAVDGLGTPLGHRHGAGVQGRQDLFHGPAAAPVSGQLLRHYRGPNQKGASTLCICFLYCRVFPRKVVGLKPGVDVPTSITGLRQSLHRHCRHQHRRASGLFHPGAVCGAELYHRNH